MAIPDASSHHMSFCWLVATPHALTINAVLTLGLSPEALAGVCCTTAMAVLCMICRLDCRADFAGHSGWFTSSGRIAGRLTLAVAPISFVCSAKLLK